MVVVPYPRGTSIPVETNPYRIDVNIRSFGGDIADALAGLSKSVGRFGDVQAEHAVKLKEQENEEKAEEAAINFMIEAGDKTAQFRTQTGENANPDTYGQYVQDLKTAQEKQTQGMNPDVVRRFNQKTRRVMAHDINSGALHTATQQKDVRTKTGISRVNLLADNAAKLPIS